jgi:uncharacterized protein (DUF1800 family)
MHAGLRRGFDGGDEKSLPNLCNSIHFAFRLPVVSSESKERAMAARDDHAGLIALTRFGFGPRGDGDLASASLDPRGFLRAELEQPGLALLSGPGLAASPVELQTLFAFQEMEKVERDKIQATQKIAAAQNTALLPATDTASQPQSPAKPQDPPAAAVFMIGRDLPTPGFTRTATLCRRWTCALCSRACWRSISARRDRCWTARSFPAAPA